MSTLEAASIGVDLKPGEMAMRCNLICVEGAVSYTHLIYLWIAGIVMPAIYIFVYYKAGLYADFGINIYYLIAAIYGWFF